MTLALWSPAYETGHADVDEQHQQLFRMINELQEAIHHGHGRDVMGPVLQRLSAYTLEHFTTEEGLMRTTCYPGYAAHKAKHDELARQVNELLVRFSEGYLTIPATLSRFLADWLRHHIKEEDLEFVAWLRDWKP